MYYSLFFLTDRGQRMLSKNMILIQRMHCNMIMLKDQIYLRRRRLLFRPTSSINRWMHAKLCVNDVTGKEATWLAVVTFYWCNVIKIKYFTYNDQMRASSFIISYWTNLVCTKEGKATYITLFVSRQSPYSRTQKVRRAYCSRLVLCQC